MFGAGGWSRWLRGQALPTAPLAEPAVAPPALQPDAEVLPGADAAARADAGAAPRPLRCSPRRHPPPHCRAEPLHRPDGSGLDAGRPDGLDAAGAPQRPLLSLRPLAALRAGEDCKLAEQLSALGMPTGPWTTDELAKAQYNVWARDRCVAGGGFSVVWGSAKAAVGTHGRLHTLVCHNHAAAKGKCAWSVTLEECEECWAVRSFHPHAATDTGHNHNLILTAVEARARSSMREIPADLVEVGKAMLQCGVSNAHVYRFLTRRVEADGTKEALFTYQDVYHACGASTGERRLDATNLVEMLRQREVDEGLFQRTTTDDAGCLKEVFFALKGAMEIYANEPERQVVEIDHKVRPARTRASRVPANAPRLDPRPHVAPPTHVQHGTNTAGLKMMLWVTVDGSGATKILACSLMMEESLESVAWSCQCFNDCFRVPPVIIFSDSARALKAAVASVFPTAKHLWCIWHLSNNMVTNLKAACGADNELWRRVSSMWWEIAKKSDESSRETFDAEWAALGALLGESTANDTESMVTARAWLAKTAAECEHWAYRFTCRYFTLGLHSTQRIEAVHSAIAHFLRASTLLTNLLPQLESYSLDVSVRASVREYRFIERLMASANLCMPHPFITALASHLTAYALVLFKVQLQQSQFYTAVAVPGEEGLFTVTRRAASWGTEGDAEAQGGDADLGISASLFTAPRMSTLTACSCQFPVCYGLPCRHMLILYIVLQRELSLALFDPRWKQRLPAAALAAEQALLLRRPPRAQAGPAAQPDRPERYALIIAAARGVAAVGAETAGGYATACDGLAQLLAKLRAPAAGHAAARRARATPGAAAAAAPAGASEGGAAGGKAPTCRSCWGMVPYPHYKNNRNCPNYGKPPLEQPCAYAPPRPVRPSREQLAGGLGSPDEDDSASEDGNDNVCHACSEDGELLMCEGCPHSYHLGCLPVEALALVDADPWLCPVCTSTPIPTGFVGNPARAPPGRGGGQQRKRFRSAIEGTKGQRKRVKAANRSRELGKW